MRSAVASSSSLDPKHFANSLSRRIYHSISAMRRQTRSGKPFGVWEGPVILPEDQNFDFEELIRAAIDLEMVACDDNASAPVDYPPIVALTNTMAAASFDQAAVEDGSACAADSLASDQDESESALSPAEKRKRKKRKSTKGARENKRKKAAAADFTHFKVRPNVSTKFVQSATPITSEKDLSKSKVVKTGYTALNKPGQEQREYTLEELVGPSSKFKFRYVPWDGSKPVPILSPTGVLTAVLAGRPNDPNWPKLAEDAADLLRDAAERVTIKEDDLLHRRGAFVALPCGVSHGGGQKKPSNLGSASKTNENIVERLNGSEPFRRISGYTNSVMAAWAPELFDYYGSHLSALYAHDGDLVPIFPRSVFAAASYNLGPRTACFPHTDFANLPFGWCAVTALGQYDFTAGGHIVLWDCGLVIEFPPGATILLPSATVTHSNTPVASDETRYSFAQYTAGAIFRWVDNGFQRSVDYYESIKDDKKKWNEQIEKDKGRWAFGLSLLPSFKIPQPANTP